MKCSACGREIVSEGLAAGYGKDARGNVFCYDCCADMDAALLDGLGVGDKTYFYLIHDGDKYEVTNWAGTFKVLCDSVTHGRHNFSGTRTDVNFCFRGKRFHATQYGTCGNVCVVRRLKDVA